MKLGHKLIPEDKGKHRTRIRFAYLPTRLTNGDLIWLDTYRHIEHVAGDSEDNNRFLWWQTDIKEVFKIGDEE